MHRHGHTCSVMEAMTHSNFKQDDLFLSGSKYCDTTPQSFVCKSYGSIAQREQAKKIEV